MPSFLNKVFGRNKDEKESSKQPKRGSTQSSLLEGKFEAVSPSVSPSAANFAERAQEKEKSKQKEKEREGGFPAVFRVRSGATSPILETSKRVEEPPHLSLNLPSLKDERSLQQLESVFEADPDSRITLSDAVIGEKRLTPAEALVLVQTCSQAIVDRGLQTLGVMHPHWYSASPDTQRRLISLFIHSLNSNTPDPSKFESEVGYTRSPHDIAAVLRWGLRHLKFETDSFGKDPSWYTTFYEAEKAASYPPAAYSTKLVPLLPPPHADLLSVTLDIVSSLAAHGEANGISGSKLTKFLGLWLLTAKRVEGSDDWKRFYARWEWAGRVLEHLFLAKIRDEALKQRMPKRLTELVAQYPYDKSTDGMLARPRFSTRKYDALYVRIEIEVPRETSLKLKQDPLGIITAAFRSESVHQGDDDAVWSAIKGKAQSGEIDASSQRLLSSIFADETVRLLSLVPAEKEGSSTDSSPPPSAALLSPSPIIRVNEPVSRSRAASAGDFDKGKTNGHAKDVSGSTSKAHQVYGGTGATDWAQFSTTGFGESSNGTKLALTLMDKDVEVTSPPANLARPKSSPRRKSSPPERGRGTASSQTPSPSTPISPIKPPKSTLVSVVQLDEAFIDFWSDALTDPISADWPSFVVCQLKSAVPEFKAFGWLVIEETLVHPPEPMPSPRPSSPRPSTQSAGGRKSSTFSIGKRKFSLFGNKDNEQTFSGGLKKKEKVGKGVRVGEMGEVLPEEDEKVHEDVKAGNGHGLKDAVAAVATAKVGAGVLAAAQAEEKESAAAEAASPSPPAEGQEPTVLATEQPAPAETTLELERIPLPAEDESPVATAAAVVSETPLASQEKDILIEGKSTENANTVPAAIVPVDATGEALPPAPETVVMSGATPGPQLALASSEPVAAAAADEVQVQAAYVEPSTGAEGSVLAKELATGEEFALVEEGAPPEEVVEVAPANAGPDQLVDAPQDVAEPNVPSAETEEHETPEAEAEVESAAEPTVTEPTLASSNGVDVTEVPERPVASEPEPETVSPQTAEVQSVVPEPVGAEPATSHPAAEPASSQVSESIAKAPSTEDVIGNQPSPEVLEHVVPEADETEVVTSTFDNEILEQGNVHEELGHESKEDAPTDPPA